MLKIHVPHIQMGSWARCLGGHIYFLGKTLLFFQFYFLINFGRVYIWPNIPKFGEKDLVDNYFSSQREFHPVPNIDFFVKLWLILSQLVSSRTGLPNFTLIILMEHCEHVICHVLSILSSYDQDYNTCILKRLFFELQAF